jgi:hypothetical protein
MAVTVLTNAMVLVNGVDLSNHASKVTTEDTRAVVDVSAMGTTVTQVAKGLGDAKITIDFFQDFTGGSVHATLQPLIASTTPVAVEVRPVNGARTATNPAILLAAAFMMNYTGLDGSVGDASAITAEFVNAGSAGMTYPTS